MWTNNGKTLIVCRYTVNMTLYRHQERGYSSALEADSQAERPPRYVLSDAAPGKKANAGDEERLAAADVELDPAAERKEIVEAQDVVLVPEIVRRCPSLHFFAAFRLPFSDSSPRYLGTSGWEWSFSG